MGAQRSTRLESIIVFIEREVIEDKKHSRRVRRLLFTRRFRWSEPALII